ncbi:hypothetical protein [Paramagnetospirillum kuznetsovii]|nr:hypothetical protein [Paramagnetospirillum kuznetsovii]
MIPRLMLAAVAAYLAVEGYSVLTAPPGLIREALEKLLARELADSESAHC